MRRRAGRVASPAEAGQGLCPESGALALHSCTHFLPYFLSLFFFKDL